MHTTFSFRRWAATTRARSTEFLRDRSSLGWNLLFPLFLVAGLAYTFSGPGKPLFKAAVIGTALPAAGTHPLLGVAEIEFYPEPSEAVALDRLAHHRVEMVVRLPPAGSPAPGQYWVNTASPKGRVLDRMMQGLGVERLERRTLSTSEVKLSDWLVPGVLGMNMMFSCLYGVGYVIVRYRKSGYLKRLNATPLTALEFLLAQVVSRLGLVMLVTVGVFLATKALVGFRMLGSGWLLLLITVLGAYAMIALSLVVAARVTSEEFAGGLLNLISWPMLMLSGVFFSLDGAPVFLQRLSLVFPLTHMLAAARAVMLDGAGIEAVGYNLAALGAMSVAFTAVGAALFRWRSD